MAHLIAETLQFLRFADPAVTAIDSQVSSDGFGTMASYSPPRRAMQRCLPLLTPSASSPGRQFLIAVQSPPRGSGAGTSPRTKAVSVSSSRTNHSSELRKDSWPSPGRTHR